MEPYKQPMLPKKALEGKVAIVTGGATGLGKAMAVEFARLGANIVIASRNQENLDQAVKEIQEYGTNAKSAQVDVRDPAQVEEMVSMAVSEFGQIDILVNNAAGNFLVEAIEMSINAWNAVINTVLNGTWYCSQYVAKQMRAQNTPGTILNVGATYAWTGGPLTAHSAAAKAAVLALTKTLAVEWAEYNIRVNMITPGSTEETGAASQLWEDPAQKRKILKNIPVNRLSTRQEVANLASYLVSDYASYVTGANHVIDGGGWLNKGKYKND